MIFIEVYNNRFNVGLKFTQMCIEMIIEEHTSTVTLSVNHTLTYKKKSCCKAARLNNNPKIHHSKSVLCLFSLKAHKHKHSCNSWTVPYIIKLIEVTVVVSSRYTNEAEL